MWTLCCHQVSRLSSCISSLGRRFYLFCLSEEKMIHRSLNKPEKVEEYSCRVNISQCLIVYLYNVSWIICNIAGSQISKFVFRKITIKMHFSYFLHNWTYSGHPGISLLTRSYQSFKTLSYLFKRSYPTPFICY